MTVRNRCHADGRNGAHRRKAGSHTGGLDPLSLYASRHYTAVTEFTSRLLNRESYRGTMSYTADPRVDAYIDALPAWQQAICRQVRDLVHAADPEVTETIKRTRQPYFVLEGNICALLAAKDHVNVFLYDGGIVPDPAGIITTRHDKKTGRPMGSRQAG